MIARATALCLLVAACSSSDRPPGPSAPATAPEPEPPPPPPAPAAPSVPGRVRASAGECPALAEASAPEPGWRGVSSIERIAVRGDGSILVKDGAGITVLDAGARRVLRRFARAWDWSPDAEWVIGRGEGEGEVVIWAAGRDRAAARIPGRSADRAAIAPGGRRLALQSGRSVDLVDRDREGPSVSVDVGSEQAPVFFLNEEAFVALTPDHATIHAFEGGRRLRDFAAPSAYLTGGWRVWTDGTAFAIARAWEPEQAKSLELPSQEWTTYGAGGPAVDRAATRIAFSREVLPNAPARVVRVYDLGSGDCLVSWTVSGGALAFSPDGSRLVAGSGSEVRVLDLATRREI